MGGGCMCKEVGGVGEGCVGICFMSLGVHFDYFVFPVAVCCATLEGSERTDCQGGWSWVRWAGNFTVVICKHS